MYTYTYIFNIKLSYGKITGLKCSKTTLETAELTLLI